MSGAYAQRRFVVSGGASGIGLAVARLAIAGGARVALIDRDEKALAAAVQALGDAALALVCDVADGPSVVATIAKAAAALGGIDALVNSAGIDARAPLEQLGDEQWLRTLDVNLSGPMRVCRAALPHLRRAAGATIVNVASAAGLTPLAERTAYCASKAGLIMFGKALAIELAADAIRVNAVCPGAIDTPLFRSSYESAADPERELEAIRQRYALRRIAEASEVAEAVLFLSSPASSYITGSALAVDGGRSFH